MSMTATEKWKGNLPMNIKELAESQKVAYKTACRWAADPSFPRVGRLVRRADFLKWWKGKAEHPSTASHHQPKVGCKSGEQFQTSGSPVAWPRKAARMRDAIASHS